MSRIETNQEAGRRIGRRRPAESAIYQQRLPAWSPNWSPQAVWPFLIGFGIVFIAIGMSLLHVSYQTPEFTLDYTHCPALDDRANRSCAEIINLRPGGSCKCVVSFTLDQPMPRAVYFYYALSNFYQNHRTFMISRDDGQLRGDVAKNPSPRCHPLTHTVRDNRTLPVAPCGLIANAMFNDSFVLELTAPFSRVPLVSGGSAWAHERRLKFRNPPGEDLRAALQNVSRPPAWSRELWELDPTDPDNNGFQNEDLISWMRSPALPNFRKRHRRVDHSVAPFERGLPPGTYRLIVQYTYPVAAFGGGKSIVLSAPSWMGARNPFLGFLFSVMGIIKLLLGCILCVVRFFFSKSDPIRERE
ncbi:cell cycle control protein 50A-like [Anopheles ziemanni]|uniref:cell cycle control protein 50A-like n=1 Tax=Anopheles coustani TaxID=139045 RepID=UPI002659105B|nr:cell cycle control protein 50A-like [Anopheles coustani]XP_058166393.1 cell cycle control protein 50A-like [Anopheles ziemanni]